MIIKTVRAFLPLFGLLLLINGCAIPVKINKAVSLTAGIEYELQPVPDELINTGNTALLTIKRDQKEHQLLVQMEISDQTLIMAGSSVEGLSLFLLKWTFDEEEIEVKKYLPISLEPLRVLAELQLTRWPLPSIKSGLTGAILIDNVSRSRKLLVEDQLVYQIDFNNNSIILQNLEAPYTLSIKQLEQWKLP